MRHKEQLGPGVKIDRETGTVRQDAEFWLRRNTAEAEEDRPFDPKFLKALGEKLGDFGPPTSVRHSRGYAAFLKNDADYRGVNKER